MYEILKDFQVLFASLFALGAAGIGFVGVWYAQKKTLENAERERKHREETAQLSLKEEENRLRMATVVAFSADLSTFLTMIEAAITIFQQAGEKKEGKHIKAEFLFGQWETPIFDAYVDKIGLLPRTLSFSIMHRYQLSRFKGYARRI